MCVIKSLTEGRHSNHINSMLLFLTQLKSKPFYSTFCLTSLLPSPFTGVFIFLCFVKQLRHLAIKLKHFVRDRRAQFDRLNLPLDAFPFDHLRCEIAGFHSRQLWFTCQKQFIRGHLVHFILRVNEQVSWADVLMFFFGFFYWPQTFTVFFFYVWLPSVLIVQTLHQSHLTDGGSLSL